MLTASACREMRPAPWCPRPSLESRASTDTGLELPDVHWPAVDVIIKPHCAVSSNHSRQQLLAHPSQSVRTVLSLTLSDHFDPSFRNGD